MTTLRFDSVGGASGDMILATLIDLGVDASELSENLSSLGIGDITINTQKVCKQGLTGTKIEIDAPGPEESPHRNLKTITNIINDSNLPASVKSCSINIFNRLAEVEAGIHNTTTDKIHFHEVGAVDSIVDITASCLCLDILNINQVVVGPLPVGSGTVSCEHGILPVPAPATMELLKGHIVRQTDEPFEMVTPTGAAILTTWKTAFKQENLSEDVVIATGTGFGSRELNNRANLLRATTLEPAGEKDIPDNKCLVLECNVDDTVPELLGALSDRLMDSGALDVFTTPAQMKKQRPGILLTALCKPADRERFLEMIFSESTTFGIREHITSRTVLDRRFEKVDTPYGAVNIKIGSWHGKDITRAPEHEDCVRLASENNVAVRTVYEAAASAGREL